MSDTVPCKPPFTVVVADDDPAWRLLVRLVLEPRGYHLVDACDGVDALHATRAWSPEVLVLDLTMPHMGGVEVCQHLHAVSKPRPGIIVMTATDDVAGLQEGRSIGADRLLVKPFNPVELLRAVESLVGNRQTDDCVRS